MVSTGPSQWGPDLKGTVRTSSTKPWRGDLLRPDPVGGSGPSTGGPWETFGDRTLEEGPNSRQKKCLVRAFLLFYYGGALKGDPSSPFSLHARAHTHTHWERMREKHPLPFPLHLVPLSLFPKLDALAEFNLGSQVEVSNQDFGMRGSS